MQIGIYGDITPPGGPSNPRGCTPIGRIMETVVTVAPGVIVSVASAPQTFHCNDVTGATAADTYTIVAVADAHADDLGSCGPGQLQSLGCYNALANDDGTATNNRVIRSCCEIGPS